MSPSRRTLLAALGVALAGCGADRRSSPSETRTETASETPTRTESPTASATATPDPAPERVALDDDRVQWRVDFDADRFAGIAAANGRLYAGVSDEPTPTPRPGETAGEGRLLALSLPDGEPVLNQSQPAPITNGPWVHDGAVYAVLGYSNGFDGRDQRLVRFDLDGDRQWESPARDAWLDRYQFDGDTAYLGTGDDALSASGETTFAVDLETGAERWAVEGGDAYGGSVVDGTLYASYAGLALAALDTGDGSERWRREVELLSSPGRSFPVADGNVFATISRDTDERFAALDAADGSTQWSRSDLDPTSVTVGAGLVIGTGYDGGVFAVDPASGETRWTRQFDGQPQPPLLADGRLVVAVREGPMVALAPETGGTEWRVDSWPGRYHAYLSATGDVLLGAASGTEELVVTARDLTDGTQRWQRRVPGRAQALERADGLLAVATEESVYGVVLD